MTDHYWTIRPARPDDLEAMLRLVRSVHGERQPELDHAYLQWRYFSDPPFRAEVVVAEHRGELIGMQPVSIFDYRFGDRRLKGAMYTGVLTHPAHRRRGVFRSLVSKANERAAARGAGFSMTMPNAASIAGFSRFGDWTSPGLIPLYAKVISPSAGISSACAAAARALSGWLPSGVSAAKLGLARLRPSASRSDDIAPADLDELAEAFADNCPSLHILRSSAYWNWRYSRRQNADYRTVAIRSAGSLVGAVVTSAGRRLGMDVGMILDVVAGGGPSTFRGVLIEAEHGLAGRGLGVIACQATSPFLQRALIETGYVRLPGRLIPKRFHFVYRLNDGSRLPRDPRLLSDWHLTFGDSDNV